MNFFRNTATLFVLFLALPIWVFAHDIDTPSTDTKEKTITVTEKKLPVNPAADRTREFMQTEIADGKTWQSVVATVPGVILNPFGQMHVRGDHNLISYSLDDMILPVLPEGQLGPLIDPRFLKSMSMETGTFDPSVSGQLGGVIQLLPFKGSGFNVEPSAGDHNQHEILASWAGFTRDDAWHFFFGAQSAHTGLRLEAPQPTQQTLNNSGDDSSGFIHVNHTFGNDAINVGLGRQVTDFGIPNTPSAQAAGVIQHERNENNFSIISWEHPWSSRFESHFGLSWLSATQSVTNNGAFTPFVIANPVTMPNANAAGLPANSTDLGSPYLPVIFRNNSQFLLSANFTEKLTDTNHLEFGGRANFIQIQDAYHIVDAGGIGTLPSPNVNLSINRSGFNGEIYVADHFTFGDKFHADAGINAARFSDGFQIQASQVNPLFNLAYALSRKETIRFSYNHIFNVPPLEPDLTGALARPELANVYDLSYEEDIKPEVKFRAGAYIKNFTNQLDGALLLPMSNVPLFTPASFDKSIDDGVEISLQSNHQNGLNGFLNYAYAIAKSAAASTSASVFLDHDQRHTLTFGVSYRWKNGAYASLDNRYGSGFPQAVAQTYNLDGIYPFGINGNNRVSNFITNLNIGFKPDDSSIGASLEILNLLNNTANINFVSDFTGTRFVKERQFLVNLYSRFR